MKTCQRCGKEFEPMGSRDKWCSTCRVIVRNERALQRWRKQKESEHFEQIRQMRNEAKRQRYYRDRGLAAPPRGSQRHGKMALIRFDPDGDFTGKRLPMIEVAFMKAHDCFSRGAILVIDGKEVVI